MTNTVVPGPDAGDNPMEILLKTEQLQAELTAILAEAQQVDEELARAINLAPALSRYRRTPGHQSGRLGLHPHRSPVMPASGA